jgi:trans-aconitate methyltransferase
MNTSEMKRRLKVTQTLEAQTPWEWQYKVSEAGVSRYVADMPAHYDLAIEEAYGLVVFVDGKRSKECDDLDEAIEWIRATMIRCYKPTIERMQDELEELQKDSNGSQDE